MLFLVCLNFDLLLSKITKNNYVAYCYPSGDTWICLYKVTIEALPSDPNRCGQCTTSDLLAGNCGNCFNGTKNCTWGTYDADLDRCVGTLNGIQMSCDYTNNCYYGATKDAKRCAGLCSTMTPGNEPVCRVGMCDETACPAGSEFVYVQTKFDTTDEYGVYGCQTKRGDYTFFYRDGNLGDTEACYIDNGKTLCGGYCTKDCSSCQTYYHEACASGRCLKDGSLIDKDGDGEDDCTCEGTVSNGRCCEKGHLYLNGGCTLLSCPEGQCLTSGGICQALTTATCRDDSGLCQTVGDEFARDDNTGACVSK